MRRWQPLFVLLVAVSAVSAAFAEETAEQKLLISVERIWDRAGHSAFTDLIRFQDELYCTFREGSGHIPGHNGVIRVIRSADGMNWESVALLAEPHVDLRDPKLSITPDERLMVSTGASYYHGSERLRIESRVAFSDADGENFSAPQKVILPDSIVSDADWLWRVTWHDDWAWGCVQQVPKAGERALHLVRSQDGINYELVASLDVDHPTETTLRFLPDETMVAMTRRTGTEPYGWIGTAQPPYDDWDFTVSNERFGGPDLAQLPNGAWLAGSRDYDGKATTQLWSLDLESAQFEHLLTLPSGGDTSYSGFVIDEPNNRIWMSYYSSHEDKTAIYLATLRLDAVMKATEQAGPAK